MSSKVVYFTPAEIAAHNCEEDIWVSFLDRVFNLTPLAAKFKGKEGRGRERRLALLFLPGLCSSHRYYSLPLPLLPPPPHR